ncbi:N-acetyltransferase [Chondrus crispus]|uniref:N-acetyltransferase n=1 Tax=Chondrus crispus TaxID=2769 RepID=R7QLT5_CHOCR|nr:N-acetyltransferase [Chondrus crispus]CDF39462.1 N-acetyltransferase [Chondrus crispus]|eukprot:XP_005719373.1 N-acetyltransferase [Chondrus crispus]
MSSTRRFRPCHLFRINPVNLDTLTETYNLNFYFQYMLRWPEFQQVVTAPDATIMAYVIGKTEGEGNLWHGHVSAVTVAPEYRRLGLASKLMTFTETLSQDTYNAFFVDLFVRKSNSLAIAMYKQMGYIVYRTILNYYGGSEDAYDMRKALTRDQEKKSMIPLAHPVKAHDFLISM